MSPKVSIAIRSYNQKDLLREAIESVLIQDYEPMEIVIGDDASEDGTQDMLREYDARHPGLFKLRLNEKNLGRIGNSNKILSACTGKYIAWLDGDDLFLPEKIKKQVRFMEDHPHCVISYHNVEDFESGTGNGKNIFGTGPGMTLPREGGVEILFRHHLYIFTCAAMTRRDASPEWEHRISPVLGGDMLFMIETAMKGDICYIPEVLSRYRKHDDNITNSWTQEDRKIYWFVIQAILEAKYPHLGRETRIARDFARDLYFTAVQKIKARHGKEGRMLLLESLRQGWVSWKWFGWYVRSFFN